MHRALSAVLASGVLAASVGLAVAGGASAAEQTTLSHAAQQTSAAGSLRFQLTARIDEVGRPPYVLHADGATSRGVAQLRLKVEDVRLPDGAVLTGPSAVEKSDGTFVYVRSTVTRSMFGDKWVREPLSALSASSPELRALRQVSPSGLLQLLHRVQGEAAADGGRVYHASLPYDDPSVRGALAGLEGGTQYRGLRLTAWVAPRSGLVQMLLLTGTAPDGSSTFLLTLTLSDYGRSIHVTPPPQGTFVDFKLPKLSE